MSRDLLVKLARRNLVHGTNNTVPQAESVVSIPASNYLDPDRWQLEVDRVWKRVPLVLGFSAELAEPGDYRTLDAMGVPVLLVRAGDGSIKGFFNSCSHRGAVVVEEASGNARRFTCPYHAWSYDQEGALVGILDRADFGEIDVSCNGLTPLACEERAGIVWGCVTPGATLNLDAYLAGYDGMLDLLGLADFTFAGRQSVAGPNWKVAYDGYLDLYHLPILHKNTFGPNYPNTAIYDAWGPHQRAVQPYDPAVVGVADPDTWSTEALTRGVWTIFPHVSIASFAAAGHRLVMVSQLFPGPDVGSSVTTQNFLSSSPITEADQVEIDQQLAFLLHVVRDEDYATGLRLQQALRSGAKDHVMFGRNEAGGQRFHGWVDALVGATDDEAAALFAKAEVIFQP